MEKMIRAVIFDMDGVVVLSEDEFTRIFTNMLSEKFNINVSEEEVGSKPGQRIEHRLKEILEKNKIKLTDETYLVLAEIGRNKYATNFSLKPNPGLLNFIDNLKENNIHVGLGTNGSKRIVMTVLDKLNLTNEFDAVVAFEDVEHPKPEPDIYLKNAEMLEVEPEECVVFEDSLSGITAAKRAGMKVIALTTTTDKNFLLDADKIIDGFYDINIEMLDEL